MKKAIFLDRDGVICKNVKDLVRVEQFEILDGVAEAIKKINDNDYLAIIVSNQPIIAKGFCSFEDIDKMHEKLKKVLDEKNAHIDGIYVCPHHPEKGFEGEVKELKIDCDCRKPKPWLLLKAAKELDIDLSQSWMVGDSKSDILAGKNAGVKTVFILGGGSGAKHEEGIDVEADAVVKDLKEAVEYILNK